MTAFEDNGYLGCFLDDTLEKPYPLTRYSGTALIDGRYEGVIDVDAPTEITVHIEETSARKLERLDANQNKLSKISIVGKPELRIVDEVNVIPADRVTFRGKVYEVIECTKENSATGHYKSMAILVNV